MEILPAAKLVDLSRSGSIYTVLAAQIVGLLDLSDIDQPTLRFEDCHFDAPLTLDRARLGALQLIRCTLPTASLQDATIGQVELDGLDIAGHLTLDGLRADTVSLRHSRVRGAVSFAAAQVARDLVVKDSTIGTGKSALLGDHARIGRRLRLGAGFHADGPVSLVAARIDSLRAEAGCDLDQLLLDRADLGDFDIEPGARVRGALAAAQLSVRGRMALAGDHQAPIRLAGCTVAGALTFQGSLAVEGVNGLDLSRLTCGRLDLGFSRFAGGVSIRQSQCTGLVLSGDYLCPPDLPLHLGVTCSGRATLGPARVTGALSLIGHSCQELSLAALTIDAHPHGRWAGVAIAARHLHVETFLRFGDGGDGVVLNGVVALDHARLGDDVRFAGVRITAPAASTIGQGEALSLRKAVLAGDLELGGLHATGSIDLSGVSVAGALRVGGLAVEGDGIIDLGGASVARLDDGQGRDWSAAGSSRMEIAAFRYADMEGKTRDDVAARLAWIEQHARAAHARGEGFSPQPYRTLVAVLEQSGHDDGVKRTELAARRQQRRLGRASPLYRVGGALLEITSGYGYAPTRAAVALLLYFLLGWAGVSLADWQGAFETSPFIDGSILAKVAVSSPHRCPWLDPPLYALDLMVPLTTLGNENFCSVRSTAEVWSWAAVGYRLFGWVILSIALLTFSGIMKREV